MMVITTAETLSKKVAFKIPYLSSNTACPFQIADSSEYNWDSRDIFLGVL